MGAEAVAGMRGELDEWDELEDIRRTNRETARIIGVSFAVSVASIVVSIVSMLR